jgi:hypothetical protein
MDDDIVLQLFLLYCNEQMPYPVWYWFLKHMSTLRLYQFHIHQRQQSMRKMEATAEVESKLNKMAPQYVGYSYWENVDQDQAVD